jgi:hypothetical protein
MRKFLFATAAAATLAMGVAVPASAQVYFGRNHVDVGPLRFGDRDYRHDYAYDRDCRTVRERIVTPSGRVIFQTRRTCD